MNGIFGRAVLAGLFAVSATFAQAALPPDFAGLPRVEPETALHIEDGGGPKSRATSKRASKKLDVQLAPPTGLELGQVRREAKEGTPLQIGFPRDVDTLADETRVHTRIEWEALANGGLLGAVQITSPTAAALRVGLRVQSLPPAAVLRFLSPEGEELFEATGQEILDTIARNRAAGDHGIEGREFWSPIIDSATLVMEVELPPGARASDFRVGLPRISHLVASAKDDFATAKVAASCTIDATCHTSTWGTEMNSVARMVFSSGGSSFLCTGTLLADGDPNTVTPYFITANHCVGSQTVASTLQTYWFYRTTSCGGANGTPTTRTGGATLLHATTRADASFMRLNTAPPAGAVFAGWIAGAPPLRGTAITGLHHPTGDTLRISFGAMIEYANCTTGASFSCMTGGATSSQYYAVRWRDGITQGGSSGSGLFLDEGKYLIGTLYGGSSSCATPTSADFYGRFDVTYNEVIRDWLGLAPSGNLVPTATSVSSGLNPSPAGQSVEFTATVTSAGGPPPGAVSFRANDVPISGCAAAPLSAGIARCVTSQLSRGNVAITAVYAGGGGYGVSTSATLTQVVNGTPTSVSVASSAPRSYELEPITFTVTISGGTVTPGGTFDVRANGATIPGCTAVPVASRTVFCASSLIAPGSYNITATYNGDWRFNPSTSPAISQQVMARPPLAKQRPQVGDFDADGLADILWYLPDGRVTMWRMNGTAPTAVDTVATTASGRFVEQVLRADLDGRADILWGNIDGSAALDLMNGALAAGSLALVGPGSGSALQATGDLDGNGRADLLWKHADGRVEAWLLGDGAVQSQPVLLPAGTPFSVALTADFNGDGKSDILWRHPDGRLIVWLMNGGSFTASGTIFTTGSTATPVFAGDFNGDGKADLVVQHGDGGTSLLLMNGTQAASVHVLQAAGSQWRMVQAGDFNADGKPDILWQNATYGNVVMWLMNGTTYMQSRTLRPQNNTWSVAQAADFNGDGRSDILWTRSNGEAAIWLMNGVDATSQASVDRVNPVIAAPAAPTVTTVAATPNPSTANQVVQLSARVTSGAGTPTGTVFFRLGATVISQCGAVPVVAGDAVCSTVLPGGTHDLSAAYAGASGFQPSTSASIVQVVNGVATGLSLSGPASSPRGTLVSFVATLGNAVAPIVGSVAFFDNGAPIAGCGTVAFAAPTQATCNVSGLALGSHAITATFTGDASNSPSAAEALAHSVVEPPPGPPVRSLVRRIVDFNGDGKEDLTWRYYDGAFALWLMNGATATAQATLRAAGSFWTLERFGDFNGDGKTDLIWRHSDGRVELWLMDGLTTIGSSVLQPSGRNWYIQAVGDFDGDGRDDLVWKTDAGAVVIDFMDGAVVRTTAMIQAGGSPFNVRHVGDFNGDGKADILWYHSDGRVIMWLMNGGTWTQSRTLQPVGSGWDAKWVTDLNGDGKSDIVWWHREGPTRASVMDGTTEVAFRDYQVPGSQWYVVGIGDFNGDGRGDLVWLHNSYGTVVLWLMDGKDYVESRTVRNVLGDHWSPHVLRDFDGDGDTDILWLRSNGGSSVMWMMQGLTPGIAAELMPAGTAGPLPAR